MGNGLHFPDMHNPIRIFIFGFITILLLMVVMALFAFHASNGDSTSSNLEVTNQLHKINLTQKLSTIIYNRTQYIQSMLLQDESSIKKSEWKSYDTFIIDYKKIREQMIPLISGQDRETMLEIDRLNDDISELIQQVSVLFINGSRREATQILLTGVLPKTSPQLAQLNELIKMQQNEAQQVIVVANQTSEQNQHNFTLYAALLIVSSLIVAVLAIFFGRRLSNQLSSQMEEINDYLEDKVNERTESLLDTQKELIEDNNELAKLASTDNLTGLFNRNHMNEILLNEHSRFIRHRHRFGIIMLDIDHFKDINDNYGHDVGDKVLLQLARLFASSTRTTDHVSRWGGEEFLICCTTLETDDIQPIAETIRKIISEAKFEVIGKLTASLGCAIIQSDESIDELIKRADVALYEAKNNGRNQTVVSAG